jgi:quercetin dioxygenase-like cupin family protein
MTMIVPSFDGALIVREADAEVLGQATVSSLLLADSDKTGGALSIMRTTMKAGIEGARPHTHHTSAELFYLLDGELQLLTGSQVITAGKGDLVVVPPDMAHAFATPPDHSADLLIVQAPGLPRFGYFRLVERLMRGEATLEEVLATQDLYDNHFLDSPTWRASRGSTWAPGGSRESLDNERKEKRASLTGTWRLRISTPLGVQTAVLELTENNGHVAGVAKTSTETVPLVNPVLHGTRLTWRLAITKPVRMTPTYEATIDGDTLTGTVKVGILPPSGITGTRERTGKEGSEQAE